MKRFFSAVFLIALTVAFTGCSVFQRYEEYPSDLTIEDLEKKMQKSSDPDGVFKSAQSYIQKQILTTKGIFFDDQYLVEVKYKRPDMFKTTTFKDNQPFSTFMFNGQKAWIINHAKKQTTELTGDSLIRMRNMSTLLMPDSTFSQSFDNLKLTQMRRDGVEYYKIVGSNSGREPITIYVNKFTLLPKWLETREAIGSQKVDYVATMDSYAFYDQVMIANQSSVKVNTMNQISKVILFRLNVELDNSEFQP
ncbi:MAG: hypothetical protein PHE87_00595 [Victivallaceae bacterium]|nr:hypothetical protein [Victivallaceae bacterium]